MPGMFMWFRLDGGTLEQPLPQDHPGADPNWSLDGNSLLFARQTDDLKPGGKLQLKIVDLKTHAVTTMPGSEGLWSPRWLPNVSLYHCNSPAR